MSSAGSGLLGILSIVGIIIGRLLGSALREYRSKNRRRNDLRR